MRRKWGGVGRPSSSREWTPLEPDVVEEKYYASGVGVVLRTTVQGVLGRIELISVSGVELPRNPRKGDTKRVPSLRHVGRCYRAGIVQRVPAGGGGEGSLLRRHLGQGGVRVERLGADVAPSRRPRRRLFVRHVPTGVLVDRFDPRRVLIAAEIVFIPVSLGMVSPAAALVVATFLLGLVGATVFAIAVGPFLTDDPDRLARINGLIEGAAWAAFVVGPALRCDHAVVGLDGIFVLDAATSVMPL